MTTTNVIQDTIEQNNIIFSKKLEATHNCINRRSEDILLLKNRMVDLEALTGLQQTSIQSSQDSIARLEETVAKLTASVLLLEKSVCRCRDRLLSLAPHYAPGEEMIEETEEEEEEEEEVGEDEEEEEGLEYATDTPLGGSYTTPPSTGGHLSPSPIPSRSPTPEGSDPENNTALHTEELEAHIEVFLEEAEEDLEMNNLPQIGRASCRERV